MATNFIGILLANSPTYTVNTGFSTQLYDAYGDQTIHVQTGASLSLLGSLGANTVRLSGNASGWQVYRDGSTAVLVNTDGSRIDLGATTTAQTLQFDDRSLGLSINTSGSAPVVVLGSQTLGTAAVVIEGAGGTSTPPTTPDIGSTVKAPWTLMMSAGTSYWSHDGIFTSDGSAAGTGLNVLEGYRVGASGSSNVDVRFKTTDDQSKAYFYEINHFSNEKIVFVGISDGSTSGTKILMSAVSNSYLPGSYVTVVGNKLVMAGGEQYPTSAGKILISDGTVTGTTLHSTEFVVPSNSTISDPMHQTLWFAGSTGPYGNELMQLSYSLEKTPSTIMVKDIFIGSSGSISNGPYYNPVSGALLPDGKLIFTANDGVYGAEPWVSDGTEAGTFMLADLNSLENSASQPDSFTPFGSKIVFFARNSNFDQLMVFTDGTSSGTSTLDINLSHTSLNPNILGQANNLLYFTAITNVSGSESKGIFSTNGTTFTRLTDINNEASLLGWNTSKAYFIASDVTHGSELWVADLVNGGFALVKDILPGSGSALSGDYSTQPMMVGDKLVFNAYTSATQQGLFVSDGTNAGTVKLSSSLPTISKVVGDTLVFATTDGIYGMDAASTAPNALKLVGSGVIDSSLPYAAASLMQTDTDQVFFKTSTGDLYATKGSTSDTIKLAGAVENFKVVAENALFFVQNNGTAEASLWYSDGTSAGTRFVEALPENFVYDLDNAVAITTVGVQP